MVIAYFSLFVGIIFAINENSSTEENFKTRVKIIRCCICVCIVSSLIFVFLPSEQTIYKMIVAQQITPNNIEYIHSAVLEDINSIVDKLIEIKER